MVKSLTPVDFSSKQFGGLSGEVSWNPGSPESLLPEGWVCAVTHSSWPKGAASLENNDKFFRLRPDQYMPDVIAACDVVLGKIGYGSASECLVMRRPLIFVPRANFAEEGYLREIMETYGNCMELSREDFVMGNWKRVVERAHVELSPRFTEKADGVSSHSVLFFFLLVVLTHWDDSYLSCRVKSAHRRYSIFWSTGKTARDGRLIE